MITKQFHISKIIKLTVIVLVILGCSNQGSAIDNFRKGKYATKNKNILETTFNRFLYNAIFIIGDTLTIHDSVNFSYTSCGNYGFGKYKIVGDSLYLNYDSSATHRDSILLYDKYTEIYYIKDKNTLINKFTVSLTKKGEEKHNAILELNYIEDTLSK